MASDHVKVEAQAPQIEGQTAETPDQGKALCGVVRKPANRLLADENGVRSNRTPDRAQTIFDWLARGFSVARAAAAAGTSRRAVYDWRDADPAFATAMRDAQEVGVDLLEDEARRRAYDGVAEPVFQRGELVGHTRRYSDQMMGLMLKARRPDVFRETVSHQHSGNVSVNFGERLRIAHEQRQGQTLEHGEEG